MPLASYSVANLQAPITVTNLGDAIKAALVTAGWGAAFDDYVSGSERFLVYQRYSQAGNASGFIRLRIATTYVRTAPMSGWNTSTKTGTDLGSEGFFSSLTNTNTLIHVFGGSEEFSGVIIQQGTATSPVIWMAPATAPTWWNRATSCYGFVPNDVAFTNFATAANSPFSSSTQWAMQSSSSMLSALNRVTNRRDSISNALMSCPSGEGVAGRFSAEIGQGACSGLARFDRLVDDSFTPQREHIVLNNASGGLIVRIV